MAVTVTRGQVDDGVRQFAAAFERYLADNPAADVSLYRHGRFSVRVRVVDPAFAKLSRGDRHDRVWAYLEPLAEETLNDLGTLVLLSPAEKVKSFASSEFDDPVPAIL